MEEHAYIPQSHFRKWPRKSVLSIYDDKGKLRTRMKHDDFDLADEMFRGPDFPLPATRYFGVRVRDKEFVKWCEEDLRRCEDNITYDLDCDGFRVSISRIKGLGLKGKEEALWGLQVDVNM